MSSREYRPHGIDKKDVLEIEQPIDRWAIREEDQELVFWCSTGNSYGDLHIKLADGKATQVRIIEVLS